MSDRIDTWLFLKFRFNFLTNVCGDLYSLHFYPKVMKLGFVTHCRVIATQTESGLRQRKHQVYLNQGHQ